MGHYCYPGPNTGLESGLISGWCRLRQRVDQSRVLMRVVAVMAMLRVTRGAGWWVPISGQCGVQVPGQGTCRLSLSTGAARSEPQRPCDRCGSRSVRASGAATGCVVAQGVPGVHGARVSAGGAHRTGMDECIYGVLLRPG